MYKALTRWTILFVSVGAALWVPLSTAKAQGRDQFQQWAAFLGTARTDTSTPGPTLWLDLHSRRGREGTVLILRPGAGVDVTSWLSLWAGYAWIPVYDDLAADRTNEHRLWQQATLSHRLAFGLALQSRTRFEQRFSDAGDDVGLRLRQFVRANWQPSASLPFGVAFWDELFLGLHETDWGAPSGLDQNRVFVGPFAQLNSWARLEAGYLFVLLDRNDTSLYQHALAVNLFVAFRPESLH